MSKKKTKSKKPKVTKKTTSLARLSAPAALAVTESPKALTKAEREDVRERMGVLLDRKKSVKEAIAQDFAHAARILGKHFSITNLALQYGSRSENGTQGAVIDNMEPEMVIEILCSAAAWLAHAGKMPKEKLVGSFRKWAEDQGYEPDLADESDA